MGIYNTVSFTRDGNHFKGFSAPTNIYPGPAARTALYLGMDTISYHVSPWGQITEDPESCCSHLACLALQSCPWPLGSPQRPSPSPFMGKAPPQGQAVWGGGEARNTPGDEGAWLFLTEEKGSGHRALNNRSVAAPGPVSSLHGYHFMPPSKQPCR